MKKPKRKRSQSKYPALVRGLNSRVRQEYLDQDYLHKLNPDELAWLNKFMAEENTASFKNDGNDFNKTKEERKKIYDRNNSRNRDQYGLIRNRVANTKLLNYEDQINVVEEELGRNIAVTQMEDAYAEYIDYKEVEEFLKEYDNAMLSFRDAATFE